MDNLKNQIKRNNIKNRFLSKPFLVSLFIKQNKHHCYGVFGHTLKVVLGTIKDKEYRFIIPGLLHDIGKPVVAYQKPEDIASKEYSFTDHEEVSYQIIKNWPFISKWTKDIVRYHYIIRDIKKSKKDNKIERLTFLEDAWNTLDKDFIKNLELFLKYDDYGKK